MKKGKKNPVRNGNLFLNSDKDTSDTLEFIEKRQDVVRIKKRLVCGRRFRLEVDTP